MATTTVTKLDLLREMKALYNPPRTPVLVDVPAMTFLMIDGQGDPNSSAAYREAVEALYAVSYTLKFAIKREESIDYRVMPLEGLWWADDMAEFIQGKKANWRWTMMIAQPDVVTPERVAAAVDEVRRKKGLAGVERLRLAPFAEGRCAQVMYLGPYADEGPTIAGLHAFIHAQGYALAGKHHEIYLSDPRRSAPEKLKTIIRQPVVSAA